MIQHVSLIYHSISRSPSSRNPVPSAAFRASRCCLFQHPPRVHLPLSPHVRPSQRSLVPLLSRGSTHPAVFKAVPTTAEEPCFTPLVVTHSFHAATVITRPQMVSIRSNPTPSTLLSAARALKCASKHFYGEQQGRRCPKKTSLLLLGLLLGSGRPRQGARGRGWARQAEAR